MAIVLPIGRFNNQVSRSLRKFVMERARVLAVVGLDKNTFQPHTATRTGVLFLQKWNDDANRGPLCPRRSKYRIFFAEQGKRCTKSNGARLFVRDDTGFLLDEHGHYMVDHDLFSQGDGGTGGIAEAFRRFARQEGLSFAKVDEMDDGHVEMGRAVEVEEVENAERWDAKYYNQRVIDFLRGVQARAVRSVRLGEIAVHNNRGVQPEHDEDGDIRLIESGNIREGWLDYDGMGRVNRNWYDANRKAHVKYGDILTYTTGKYIGRTAVYLSREPAACNNHVNILRIRDEDPTYVAFVMNSSIGRAQTERLYGGGGQGELYPKDMAEFVVPFVRREEIRQIVAMLRKADSARRRAVKITGDANNLLGSRLTNDGIGADG